MRPRLLLIIIAIMAFAVITVVQARMAAQDTSGLLQAEQQVAAIFRDVIARNAALPAPVRENLTAAQLVFYKGGSELNESVTLGNEWQEVRPAGNVSLKLPAGVIVSAWTFGINAFRPVKRWQNGHGDVGIPPGTITLTTVHGANGDVHVEHDGRVWYQ